LSASEFQPIIDNTVDITFTGADRPLEAPESGCAISVSVWAGPAPPTRFGCGEGAADGPALGAPNRSAALSGTPAALDPDRVGGGGASLSALLAAPGPRTAEPVGSDADFSAPGCGVTVLECLAAGAPVGAPTGPVALTPECVCAPPLLRTMPTPGSTPPPGPGDGDADGDAETLLEPTAVDGPATPEGFDTAPEEDTDPEAPSDDEVPADDEPAGVEVVPDGDEPGEVGPPDVEVEPVDVAPEAEPAAAVVDESPAEASAGPAQATAGVSATAAPTPNATAKTPTRPT
jgi:nicotinate-nucleotide--dimethylbenzimidazole phosphoribosyltransferase